MKRLLILGLCLFLFAGSTFPVMACRRHTRYYSSYNYRARRARTVYVYPQRTYLAHRRSFWQRHRDALTLAMGTGGGMGVGALLGGKRGAGIGALVGLGSSAVYTYKLRDRRRHY